MTKASLMATCMLLATGSCDQIFIADYDKQIDLQSLSHKFATQPDRTKVNDNSEVEIADPFLLAIKTNSLLMSSVKPGSTDEQTYKTPSVRQVDPEQEINEITLYDWGTFATGLFLGFFLTIGASGFAGFFSPCMQQRAYIVNAAFFFFSNMLTFEESEFLDQNAMGMMVLMFIQFGIGLNMGMCGEEEKGNHGSFDANGQTSAIRDIFTLDIENLKEKAGIDNPLMGYFSKMFDLYGQDSSSSNSDDSLLANIGLLGAAQALTAYENYLSFNERWLSERYFEAGTFLGAAIVDGAIVFYLFLLAGALNE